MTTVADICHNANSELRKLVNSFDTHWAWKKQIRAYNDIAVYLNVLAIGAALTECDVESFSKNLATAANDGRRFLIYAHRKGEQVPAFYNLPLLSALAINRLGLAAQIASVSAREKSPWEYDDEFYGALFVQEYVLNSVESDKETVNLGVICDKIDEYLEMPTPRVQFFRALLSKDLETARSAFGDWNREVAEEYDKKNQAEVGSYWDIVTRRIWIEGLAMIRMAEYRGFQFDEDYLLIPTIVRHIDKVPAEELPILRLPD